ncbi:MAG: hypothetical protein WEA10_04085 [Actinomycetota bacterium]
MSFNLFGDLAADIPLADRAVHTWWPDLLVDRSAFSTMTVEELLDGGALPSPTVAALKARYLRG